MLLLLGIHEVDILYRFFCHQVISSRWSIRLDVQFS
jgi:hypothetical protein